MRISVKCFATLARHNPPDGFLELEEQATVRAVLPLLGLVPADVKIIFVNSRHSTLDTVLQHEDQVGLFPAVGGG